MPIKHTSNSYRNKDNILYFSWGDYPTKNMAEVQIDYFHRYGLKAFKENHQDYYRVFVEAHKAKEKGLF